jgi:SAM-dependent methyltransferase
MKNINVGCGTHYAKGWTNIDLVYLPEHKTTPDVVADPLKGLPIPDNSVDRVYLGHILEHIRWDHIVDFATEMLRVLVPGGECAVVGPDFFLTIDLWSKGALPLSGVRGVMENAAPFLNGGEGWDGARHQWNCYESRASDVMQHAGFEIDESFTGRLTHLRKAKWPVIAPEAKYQFAFLCRKPAT